MILAVLAASDVAVLVLLVGLLGFVFTGFGDFAATSDDKLLLFGVNPLHNIVHLAVGALWLASSRTESSARAVSILIGAVYLVVGIAVYFLYGIRKSKLGRGILVVGGEGEPHELPHRVGEEPRGQG